MECLLTLITGRLVNHLKEHISMYNAGAEGLPYELIINSDPSIAYLMRQNELFLQILIMAHCVGHSDFFKNNRCFKDTDPKNVVSRMRNAKKRIQGYVENPSIGIDQVESFIDNLQALSFQTNRYGIPVKSKLEIRQSEIERYNLLKEMGINLDQKHLEKNFCNLTTIFCFLSRVWSDTNLKIGNLIFLISCIENLCILFPK
jgi:spore cortex formation protein SpoVR/YcgB (stage V sporulation)